jgi:diketogulonate reductase-like aldo/keto reductase
MNLNVQTDPKPIEIAHAIKITPTQPALSWAVQRGTSVIPKSSNLERLRSNRESMCISIRKIKTLYSVLYRLQNAALSCGTLKQDYGKSE